MLSKSALNMIAAVLLVVALGFSIILGNELAQKLSKKLDTRRELYKIIPD